MRFTPRMSFGRWYQNSAVDDMRVSELLEALVRINARILRANPQLPGLYAAHAAGLVKYGNAPVYGCIADACDDPWADCLDVLETGKADCEEAGAYRAGELRARHGIAARCTFTKVWNERERRFEYHVDVTLPNGTREDPARAIGMR